MAETNDRGYNVFKKCPGAFPTPEQMHSRTTLPQVACAWSPYFLLVSLFNSGKPQSDIPLLILRTCISQPVIRHGKNYLKFKYPRLPLKRCSSVQNPICHQAVPTDNA